MFESLVCALVLASSPPAAPTNPTPPNVPTPTAPAPAAELTPAQKEAAIMKAAESANAPAAAAAPTPTAEPAHVEEKGADKAAASAPPGLKTKKTKAGGGISIGGTEPAKDEHAAPAAAPAATAEKGHGKEDKGGHGAPAARAKDEGSPSTRAGLCADLTRASKEQLKARTKLDEDRAALASERTRLEALVKEIEEARAALREETKRLEGMTAKAGGGGGATPAANGGGKSSAGGYDAGQVTTLAKTLKSMKPDQAAGLLSRVDKALAVEILRGMKPNDAGKLLDKLKPDMAADLMADLANGGN